MNLTTFNAGMQESEDVDIPDYDEVVDMGN